MVPITEEVIFAEMKDAFNYINLESYNSMLRIKKPQPQALSACQMLCKLVASFRGGQSKNSGDGQFSDWKQILEFVHRKPNVIKFNQEITQLIHHMILSQEYLR